jgi:glutamate synthase (ferredoxin)
VVNFFTFIAEEVRSLLARLGYRSLPDIVGARICCSPADGVALAKTQCPGPLNPDRFARCEDPPHLARTMAVHSNGPVLDDEFWQMPICRQRSPSRARCSKTFSVINTDRTIGARVAGAIAAKYGNGGFEGSSTSPLRAVRPELWGL